MKKILGSFCVLISFSGFAQLHSGTPVVQSKPQPVPNSSASEKSATPQPVIKAPPANPVAPIYPGGEVKAIEIPRQLIFPPTTPSSTQPNQKEPLSPIESTNNLKPNRPQREERSRDNRAIEIPTGREIINKRFETKTVGTKNSTKKNGKIPINKKIITTTSNKKKKTT